MDTTRLNKVSRLIQKELGIYFQKETYTFKGAMISVTTARVTSDLSEAKIYISIFPPQKSEEVFKIIQESHRTIRYDLGQKVRHQLRKVPELRFYIDDSIDYAEKIEDLLK